MHTHAFHLCVKRLVNLIIIIIINLRKISVGRLRGDYYFRFVLFICLLKGEYDTGEISVLTRIKNQKLPGKLIYDIHVLATRFRRKTRYIWHTIQSSWLLAV